MLTFWKSSFFIKSSTKDSNNILPVKLPVCILKPMKEWIVAYN